MNRLFSITLWVAIILSIPAFILSAASLVFITGTSAALGLLFSVLYLAVVLWIFSKTPLWPRFNYPGAKQKKGRVFSWVCGSLMWGAFVCFGLIMLVALPVMEITDKLNWGFVSMSFAGAYPEEIAKALGVAIILMAYRELNRPWHGFITGALVGLGFEVNENLLYGATGALMDPNSDLDGMLMMWGYRTVAGPLIHTLLTALAGYGIALALFRAQKTTAWRWGMVLGWGFVAFALHFTWNLLWENQYIAIANYIVVSLIMYPLAGFIIWRSWREAREDESYAYAPGIITSTQELAFLDAPAGEAVEAERS